MARRSPDGARWRALLAAPGPILADGAMGTMLFEAGLTSGESPERWNVERPDVVRAVHRAYRDAAQWDRARAELRAALKLDPRVRYAHYYLGMVAARQGDRAALAEAIDEFRAEVKLAPADPLANLELGVALAEGQRWEEALPALETAARSSPPHARTLYYLGRARLANERAADGAASLARALELAQAQGANAPRPGSNRSPGPRKGSACRRRRKRCRRAGSTRRAPPARGPQ